MNDYSTWWQAGWLTETNAEGKHHQRWRSAARIHRCLIVCLIRSEHTHISARTIAVEILSGSFRGVYKRGEVMGGFFLVLGRCDRRRRTEAVTTTRLRCPWGVRNVRLAALWQGSHRHRHDNDFCDFFLLKHLYKRMWNNLDQELASVRCSLSGR